MRFEKNLIRQLLSEDIMRESVIYQDIIQKEAFKLINRQLNRRFSQMDASLTERVQKLSAEQIENLAEEFVDFSDVSDLEAWLNQQEES